MEKNEETTPVPAPGIVHLEDLGVAITPLFNLQEQSLPVSVSEVEGVSISEGDKNVSLESKPDDLDSDLYYNQEVEEEEETDNGSASSAHEKEETYESLLSEFDDFVANQKSGAMVGTSRALRYGFKIGDMVWGKVKSHPWWPGLIFDEGFASSSVRRTRREGHVLVAFFGDSSYGWFDPAELIPFEDNFEEKSQQTNAKHFVKAVEEAVDEASRRSSLGLLCKCRARLNFRSTGVDGYYAVDVPDFEPNGVYSEKQIVQYREDFQPSAMLYFVKHVAAVSRDIDVTSMDFVKSKSAVFAYRRASFEEFDETYDQAFGPSSSSFSKTASSSSDQPVSARAPLSGPLVIAEALSEVKDSNLSLKGNDHLKQERYVLMKREHQSDRNIFSASQKVSDALDSMAYEEDSSTTRPMVLNSDDPIRSESEIKKEFGQVNKVKTLVDTKYSLDPERGYSEVVQNVPNVVNFVNSDVANSATEGRTLQDSDISPEAMTIDIAKVPDNEFVPHPQQSDNNLHLVIKKDKILKRALVDSGSNSLAMKKKRKKSLTAELISGSKMQDVTEKTFQNPGVILQKKDGALHPSITLANVEYNVPNLLKELHTVALESFSGLPRKISSSAMQFLLRFRSVNYQKSLAVATPSNTEQLETVTTKPSVVKVVRLKPGNRGISKDGKILSKPIDPTISGRKRMPTDRLEEFPSKKLKSIEKMKSLTDQKKTSTKPVESASVVSTQKPVKQNISKQQAEPAMLVMRFPPHTSLPSGAELKAKFARFGSIDLSAIRIFWRSSTCRLVFRQKRDAEAAFKYAMANTSLFGNLDVRYSVREVGRDDYPSESPFPDRSVPGNGNPLPLHSGPIKSILKKPSGEDAGQPSTGGNTGRGNRVKFMLAGEESVPQEFTKKIQKPLPPSQLPPLLPLPQFGKPLQNQPPPPRLQSDPPRNLHLANIPSPAAPSTDISNQMLSLLTRCNDVVSSISGIYGYVPYHPI